MLFLLFQPIKSKLKKQGREREQKGVEFLLFFEPACLKFRLHHDVLPLLVLVRRARRALLRRAGVHAPGLG